MKEWTYNTVQRLQTPEETWNNQVEYHLNMRSLLSYTSISEDSFISNSMFTNLSTNYVNCKMPLNISNLSKTMYTVKCH